MAGLIELAPARHKGLTLRNPVIAGAGTIGYGREVARILPLARFGAVVTNTTTLRPRAGSPQPRLVETPAALLMSTGVQNPGLRPVLRRNAAAWARLDVPVILSIAGEDVESLLRCAELADNADSLAGLELEPDLLGEDTDLVTVVDALRGATDLPLLVRVPVAPPPAVANVITDLAAVGADAVVIGSPWPGLEMDVVAGRPLLSGSLMGPAIRPLALRLVYDVVHILGPDRPPIIAAGGIATAEHVAVFLAAGAVAVQVDTAMYVNLAAVLRAASNEQRAVRSEQSAG